MGTTEGPLTPDEDRRSGAVPDTGKRRRLEDAVPALPAIVAGDPELTRILAGIGLQTAQRLDAVESLRADTKALAEEVGGLREVLGRLEESALTKDDAKRTLPTKDELDAEVRRAELEVTVRRRAAVLAMAVAIVAGAWATDAHVEWCGPYARSNGYEATGVVEDICDASFPLHDHGDQQGTGRVIGAGAWVGAAFLAYLRLVRPYLRHDGRPTR